MSLLAIGGVISTVGKVIDDLHTSERESRELDIREAVALQKTDLAQMEVNKVEAAHPSMFVAGWRPAVGWVATTALAVAYIPKALVLTGMWTYQAWSILNAWKAGQPIPPLPAYPDLGITDLIGLLGAILGIGGLRSLDKRAGKDTRRVADKSAQAAGPQGDVMP
jgi:hypothetical protein